VLALILLNWLHHACFKFSIRIEDPAVMCMLDEASDADVAGTLSGFQSQFIV